LNEKYRKSVEQAIRNAQQEGKKTLSPDEKFGVQIEDNDAFETIKRLVSQTIPTILYGGNASTVTNISIASKQDPLLTSVQMLARGAGRPAVTQPNGGGTMGLPLRTLPAQITVTMLGCPSLRYAQLWMLDLGSGTTLDNRYGITGLTHTISAGRFESSANACWMDGYGQFEANGTLLKYVSELTIPEE
jgi:hypothetical protein